MAKLTEKELKILNFLFDKIGDDKEQVVLPETLQKALKKKTKAEQAKTETKPDSEKKDEPKDKITENKDDELAKLKAELETKKREQELAEVKKELASFNTTDDKEVAEKSGETEKPYKYTPRALQAQLDAEKGNK